MRFSSVDSNDSDSNNARNSLWPRYKSVYKANSFVITFYFMFDAHVIMLL